MGDLAVVSPRGGRARLPSLRLSRRAAHLGVLVGTGELKGISGRMNIIIDPDGKHSYEFDYTIG